MPIKEGILGSTFQYPLQADLARIHLVFIK